MVSEAVEWHAGKASDWERMRLGVGGYTGEKQRLALRSLDAKAGEAVLDLGTGSGFFARAAARNGARVFAVDAAESMIRVAGGLAGSEGLDITFVRADVRSVPFRDGSFDKTIAVDLVGHLPDPADCVSEIGRVTKKRAVIAWPHSRSPYRLKYLLEKRVLFRSMPFTRWLSVRSVRRLMSDAGFTAKGMMTSWGITAIIEGEKT